MRPVIPIKREELESLYTDHCDYYITNLSSPSEYLDLPVLPKVHLWCPLNSFNIPPQIAAVSKDYVSGSKEPSHIHLTLLQGAGDILHLSPFIRLMKETYPRANFIHYTYSKFSGLSDLPEYCFEPGTIPNDLLYHQLKGWHSQGTRRLSFHHPPAARGLQRQCLQLGWDKYDWLSLVCGIRIDNKEIRLEKKLPQLDLPQDCQTVGIHYLASSMDRTWYDALELVSYCNLVYPNIKFILFGGEAEQQLGDFLGVTNLAGKLSYQESAGLIDCLDALICVDSVVLHLAKLSKTPTLGLFGWSPASWSGPYPNNIDFIEHSNMSINMEGVLEWMKLNLKLR